MASWLSTTRSLGKPPVKNGDSKSFNYWHKRLLNRNSQPSRRQEWEYPKFIPRGEQKYTGIDRTLNWLQGLMGTKPSKSKKMVW